MTRYSPALMIALFAAVPAHALSVAEFGNLCNQPAGTACHDLPAVQAYVGGALDIIATAQEEGLLKHPAFCKKPQDIFKVPAIIDFMQAHARKDDKRNAMYLLLQYLEEQGGCEKGAK